jgi:hypothetical protein
MFDCRDVSKRFYQDAVSTKARRISETTSSDRHYSSDQLEAISLSIEMLDFENILKDRCQNNDSETIKKKRRTLFRRRKFDVLIESI